MADHLFEVSEEIYGRKPTQTNNARRMSSVVVLLCCLHQMIIYKELEVERLPWDKVSVLLSMLRLMPEVLSQDCFDWVQLQKFIPDSFREEACEAIRVVAVHLSRAKQFDYYQWLFALPVVHFLHGSSRPFQELEFDPRAIQWEDKLLQLGTIRKTTRDKEFK